MKRNFCEFLDNLIAHSFLPKITFPTRFTRTNGTLIDNIFSKRTRSTTNIKSGILIKTFSDHQPYFTILPATQPIARTRTPTQRHQINETTLRNVDIELQKSQIITKMELNLLSDPNINYNIMEKEITKANRKYIIKKFDKFNKYKHKKSKWITKGILKSMKHRDALYKELRLTNPYSANYNRLLRNLKTFNSILKRSIRFAKKSYYASQFNICKNDSKKTWKTINSLLSNHKIKALPELFREDQTIMTDDIQIANKFNTFFTNIGLNLASNINIQSYKNYATYLNAQNNDFFTFQDVDECVISKIIDNLPAKKSCGPDGISLIQLKYIKGTLLTPITLII